MSKNPIIGFQVDPADIQYIGRDLQRPECILADEKGLRIVAEGFKFTNEIRLDAAEQYPLYRGNLRNSVDLINQSTK